MLAKMRTTCVETQILLHLRSLNGSQLIYADIYVQNFFILNIDGLLTTGLSAGDIDLHRRLPYTFTRMLACYN